MRERKESSQVPCALGLIETSANIERCSGREPVFVHPNEALPPPFIDQGGESYTCRTSTGRLLSPRSGGEQLVFPVTERCGARRRAWVSGVGVVLASPLTVPRACPRPVAPVDGVAMTAGRAVPHVGGGGTSRVPPGRSSPGQEPYCCSRVVAHAHRGSYKGKRYKG